MASVNEFLATCFIQDLVDDTSLRFQFIPEEVAESKDVNWEEMVTSGRTYPIKGYGSSGATGFTVSLTFFDDAGPLPRKVDINRIIWWIRSLAAPDYSRGWIASPHPVLFNMGKFISMTAVVTGIGISYKAPWDLVNLMPKFIEVTVSLSEIGDNPFGSDVYALRSKAGLAGVTGAEISGYVGPPPGAGG